MLMGLMLISLTENLCASKSIKNWQAQLKNNNSGNYFLSLLRELESIQKDLTSDPMANALWLQDKLLQDKFHQYAMEQELYWVQRAHQNQIQSGGKNTKYFQLAATIRKRSNFI